MKNLPENSNFKIKKLFFARPPSFPFFERSRSATKADPTNQGFESFLWSSEERRPKDTRNLIIGPFPTRAPPIATPEESCQSSLREQHGAYLLIAVPDNDNGGKNRFIVGKIDENKGNELIYFGIR